MKKKIYLTKQAWPVRKQIGKFLNRDHLSDRRIKKEEEEEEYLRGRRGFKFFIVFLYIYIYIITNMYYLQTK